MRIIIVGDKGFIGSALKKELRKQGHTIVPEYKKADVCFFLANRGEDAYERFAENLTSLNQTLEQVRTQPIKFILISSAKVNTLREQKDLLDSYAVTKHIMEQMVVCQFLQKESKFRYIIVRLNNVYGKGQTNPNVIGDLIKKTRVAKSSGTATMPLDNPSDINSFLYIDDCIEALTELIYMPENKVITLGHPEAWSVLGVATVIKHLLNAHFHWVHFSTRLHIVRLADNLLVDWQPKIGLVEGIKKMI